MKNDPQRESTVLQHAATTRKIDALFRQMSSDFLLREQFITDPAQILAEYVHGEKLSPQQAQAGNVLIYSVLSNPRLLTWFRNYAVEHRTRPPSIRTFARDFGQAVAQQGAEFVVHALFRSAYETTGLPRFDEAMLHYMLAAFIMGRAEEVVDTGTDGTDGTSITGIEGTNGTGITGTDGTGTGITGTNGTGTGITGTDGTGTGITGTDGTGTGITGTDGTGTGITNGTGTSITGITGTNTGTGTLITLYTGTSITDITALTAFTGTDTTFTAITLSTFFTMTGTGTGTTPFTLTGGGTRGPFTGTDISTGAVTLQGTFFGSNYVLGVLGALVQYSMELAQSGALAPEA